MSKESDRARLLAKAKSAGVKVERGTPSADIEKQMNDKAAAKYEVLRNHRRDDKKK